MPRYAIAYRDTRLELITGFESGKLSFTEFIKALKTALIGQKQKFTFHGGSRCFTKIKTK